jgi:hypothetical protein
VPGGFDDRVAAQAVNYIDSRFGQLTFFVVSSKLAPMTRPLVVALALVLASGSALADEPRSETTASARPYSIGAQPAWFVLAGLTTGGTVGIDDKGGFVGGELSVVRLDRGVFVGLYADGYYDFGVDAPMVTAGPELGYSLFALDGGVAYRRRDDSDDLGVTARITLGLGMFGIFGRYAYFDDVADNEHVIQVGALLKLPLYVNR